MANSDVVVETRRLTKVYRDFWGRQKKVALRALNLQINRGEIFGLLGPNGSGKTTTIKLLLGLLFPTEGQAVVFDLPATDVSKNERIGYLPEESYLYRFLNAEETLDFYGRLFKKGEQTRRIGGVRFRVQDRLGEGATANGRFLVGPADVNRFNGRPRFASFRFLPLLQSRTSGARNSKSGCSYFRKARVFCARRADCESVLSGTVFRSTQAMVSR